MLVYGKRTENRQCNLHRSAPQTIAIPGHECKKPRPHSIEPGERGLGWKTGKGGTVRTCDMQSQSLLLLQLSYAPIFVVPSAGLEPACLWAPGSEPGASANSATRG